MTDMIEQAQLADYELADRYRLENGRVFLSGLQAIARLPLDQIRADRRRGSQHRRLRVGLPGLAGRCVRRRGRARRPLHRRPADRVPAGHQRGVGGHRGDGQPADEHAAGLHVRRRDRHVVRQGARARSGERCHPPRRVRRHVTARWGDRPRGRRSGCQVVDVAVVERRHDGRPPHADLLPGRCAGGARPQPPRHRPVAFVRSVVRHQARQPGRRRHRHRRHPPRPRRAPDPDDDLRRQAVRAAPGRSPDDALHARHGA